MPDPLSDHEALHAGVLARPDADLPRLVYADFLEERGADADLARAQFIRVQCELARLPGRGPEDFRETLDLRVREKVLLERHHRAWLAPLRQRGEALQNAGTHGVFRRGFVELVWMPAAIFTAKAAKLFGRAPVAELRVTRTTLAELAALLAEPLAGRLTALDLCDRGLGDAAAERLVASPVLPGLRTLRLKACNLTDDGAGLLLAAPASWRPERLELDFNPIGPAARRALVERFGPAVV